MATGLFSSTAAKLVAAAGLAALAASATAVLAGPNDNKLVVDGKEYVTKLPGPEGGPLKTIYSGWNFRNEATQAMQLDDFDNPGFVNVETGEQLWSAVDGEAGKSCASCHNDASESMKGVRAQMPKWNEKAGKPLALEQVVNACRETNMKAKPWKWESNEMLSMTAFIGSHSRGMPVNVKTDGPMKEWWQKGKDIYYKQVGQLDMSCAGCHEQNFGNMIRADHLSQGHINGFPLYRSKWQKLGSAHRRFKGCMKNIRATPYKVGGDEFVALELYVASRGQGLSVETPAVRN
ncbi:MAG: sulfur oxidation c-type cytochrome SoxA [Alphaproteobacteria bacterium]|nr:sulfur oxidation c-type cytochrome SoxA [Alphaproteobacteria bacterium]